MLVAISDKKATDPSSSSGDTCTVCLCNFTDKKTLSKCGHSFCAACIDRAFKVQKKCPVCSTVYGLLIGNQPEGKMFVKLTFTIGRSLTTGADNVITWNGIHHKTNIRGGPIKYVKNLLCFNFTFVYGDNVEFFCPKFCILCILSYYDIFYIFTFLYLIQALIQTLILNSILFVMF